ncbi:MAG: hypothetical protein RIQ52_2130, partial [Pseudomonadota bacterium]
PSPVQARILKWALRFQNDPASKGIHYENIQAARDPALKSVRIDQDLRGIVFKPPAGDLYVLLYVDHHDDAYRWAIQRKIAVNPVTGAMQIVFVEEVFERIVRPDPAVSGSAPLFAALKDRELLSLGVPESNLARVREITGEDELDALQAILPVEAYEGLFLFAAGDSVDQILAARDTRVDLSINTEDFSGSLERAESQSRFVVVADDEALIAIMNAPLAQWRVFLHPTQKKLATKDLSGPARVLGGAGTGKTVLAMHRAKWLAENVCGPQQKVLLTTFTRNLAMDIEENLKTFCAPAIMEKIEVRNLDAWVFGFLRSQKYEHRIVYNRKKEAWEAWTIALGLRDTSLDLPDRFYEEELDQVILAQGITSRDDYRMARRAGRGTVLNRVKRDAIWPVFEEYRYQLSSRKLKEVDDAYRDAAELLRNNRSLAYRAMVIDETQDFGPQALRLIRAMVAEDRNDLFFVGDGHQRIYSRNRAALGRCGIDIRGRSRKLYINYRTTDEIRRQALACLEGCEIDDLDEGVDEIRRYKSLAHGEVPFQEHYGNIEEVSDALQSHLARWMDASDGQAMVTCVIVPDQRTRDALYQTCRSQWPCALIEADSSASAEHARLFFATMHRAKGLEFDQVIAISRLSLQGPPEDSAEQRRLLYVALTRAKRRAGMIFW